MSREKQIEEMAKATMKYCKTDNRCGSCHWSTCNECMSEFLYNAGYRKQIEGEWVKQKPDHEAMKVFHEKGLGNGMSVNSIYWTCSVCDNWGTPHHKYCSSCGAKMKGGE